MTKTELSFYLKTGDNKTEHLITIESDILPAIGSNLYINTEINKNWFESRFSNLSESNKESYLSSQFRGKVKILSIYSGIKTIDIVVEEKTELGVYTFPSRKNIYYHEITVVKV